MEHGGVTELARTYDAIYAVRFGQNPIPGGISTAELSDMFHLIENEWVYDNWAIIEE